MPVDHEAITAVMMSQGPYGTGVHPNPFAPNQAEWRRRMEQGPAIAMINEKIESLFEPRFITPPETSEAIAAIVTMTDSRKVLEIGMHTGFTSLHILRALVGKPGVKFVTVDHRPAHDQAFFAQFPFHRHVFEPTPGSLKQLHGEIFDLVFVDSDHSLDHTKAELEALLPIIDTKTILLFHDMPEWIAPNRQHAYPVRNWLADNPTLRGVFLPSCEQLDCREEWGASYPKQCNPGLAIFKRK